MTIRFADNSGTAAIMDALNGLSGWTVQGEFTNAGFPEDLAVVRAQPDGVTFCDVDSSGRPQTHTAWLIGYDEIRSITVV